MMEMPSQIRIETKEVMSGFPRSLERALPIGGNCPDAVVSALYWSFDRGDLVKPDNPTFLQANPS